jgi:hypothetical protein
MMVSATCPVTKLARVWAERVGFADRGQTYRIQFLRSQVVNSGTNFGRKNRILYV